jgi:hypothetical protein
MMATEAAVTERALDVGHTVQVDTVTDVEWGDHVRAFADGNLYQLWQIEPKRFRRGSRLVLRRDDVVVAAADVRLFTVPLTRRGIAYVRWGPLWRQRDDVEDSAVFRQALRALYNEYVMRRGLVLRLLPRVWDSGSLDYPGIAREEGFSGVRHVKPGRTLMMELAGRDLDTLRKGLAQKWRNCLNKAERAGLTVTCGASLELVDDFHRVYKEMLDRKGFAPTADIGKHRRLQEMLPDHLKMTTLVAYRGGQPCAGVIYSAIGSTAVYLFGATNMLGMQTSASYLLQWEVIRRLCEGGTRNYDLHGVDPQTNPGTYHFKSGLAGRHGREMTSIGQLEAFRPSLASQWILRAERLRHRLQWRRVRRAFTGPVNAAERA